MYINVRKLFKGGNYMRKYGMPKAVRNSTEGAVVGRASELLTKQSVRADRTPLNQAINTLNWLRCLEKLITAEEQCTQICSIEICTVQVICEH